jgi:hypothetical protein
MLASMCFPGGDGSGYVRLRFVQSAAGFGMYVVD